MKIPIPSGPNLKRMFAQRLLSLAEFLEKLPAHRFDYRYWVGSSWQGEQDLSCGTTACALGWAATMPRFRRLGLFLNKQGVNVVSLKGQEYIGVLAVGRKIFGVEAHEFHYLFTGDNNLSPRPTPKMVAKLIRGFVKERTNQHAEN